MSDIRERFIKILDEIYKGNQSQLAASIGLTQGHISNIVNRGSKPSADILSKTIEVTDISADWLLTGKGEMLRKPNGVEHNISDSVVGSVTGNIGAHSTISNSMSQKNFSPNSSTEEKQSEEEGTIEQLKNEIRVKEEKIREMERTITSQEKTIIAQEKMISLLERN